MAIDELDFSWLACGWTPVRKEGVLKVASRLRAMAAGIEGVDASLGELWPQLAPRRLKPSDPGPLTSLSDEDLARLIDKRCRADPPPFPAPVARGGYCLTLSDGPGTRDGVFLGAFVWVESDLYSLQEPVRLLISNDSAVWQSVEAGRSLLRELVRAWSADWAAAYTWVHLGLRENGVLVSHLRPWMIWTASGRQTPPDWIRDAGPPMDVRAEGEGELCVWPWPPIVNASDRAGLRQF